jgi:hypothetical protein
LSSKGKQAPGSRTVIYVDKPQAFNKLGCKALAKIPPMPPKTSDTCKSPTYTILKHNVVVKD